MAVRIIIATAHAAPCLSRSHKLGALVAVTVTSASVPPSMVCTDSVAVSVLSSAVKSAVSLLRCSSPCVCLILAFNGLCPVAGSGCFSVSKTSISVTVVPRLRVSLVRVASWCWVCTSHPLVLIVTCSTVSSLVCSTTFR